MHDGKGTRATPNERGARPDGTPPRSLRHTTRDQREVSPVFILAMPTVF
jgi:hypothetical protein